MDALEIVGIAPVHVGDGWDWACPFRVDGLGEPITGQAHGIDALQALQLVSAAIRGALEHAGVPLRWHDADFWQAGFPRHVEAFGAPELEDVLLTQMNDATTRWMAARSRRRGEADGS